MVTTRSKKTNDENVSVSNIKTDASSKGKGGRKSLSISKKETTSITKRESLDKVVTPKKGSAALKRKPFTPIAKRKLVAPPTPVLTTPQKIQLYVEIVNKRKPTEYELARMRLMSSTFPTDLPCREKELEEIHLHLRNALLQRAGCCLYISGVPGTGKTATIQKVIQKLQQESYKDNKQTKSTKIHEQSIDSFRYVAINGLKLTDPKQVYVSLWRAINDTPHLKISSQRALEYLEEYFTDPNQKDRKSKSNSDKPIDIPPRMMNIVVMDELDILINRSQSVIYNFFEWPNRIGSNLIVVAIANTMDLPERLLCNKVSSRLGLRRINFQPYTHTQLAQIIHSRLAELLGSTFDKDAIELCSRKVSAVSGDARKALAICHRATELVLDPQSSATSKSTSTSTTKSKKVVNENDTNLKNTKVTMELIHSAMKELYLSSGVATLQKCSFHQKLFVVALIKCFWRDSIAETSLAQVIDFHGQLCRVHQHYHNALNPLSDVLNSESGLSNEERAVVYQSHANLPSLSDMLSIALHLNSCKCILLEGGKAELYSRIRLYLNEDETVRVLSSSDPLFKKILSGQSNTN
jgi:Cdc6-like AAA superfamily ATPase